MKVFVSALLLAIGTSDAFTGPASSKPAMALEAVRGLTGGIEGSNIMDDRAPPNLDAPWGSNPLHKAPQYYPPSPKQGTGGFTGGIAGSSLLSDKVDIDAPWGNSKNPFVRPAGRAANGHGGSMTGGIGGSTLVDEAIDVNSAFNNEYYRLHGLNPNVGRRAGHYPTDVPARKAAPKPPPVFAQAAIPPPPPAAEVPPIAQPVAKAAPPMSGNPNPVFPS